MISDQIEAVAKSASYWKHSPEQYNISVYGSLSSVERMCAERGYSQGIADERRRSREHIKKIARKLKCRGYPLEHISEDTGIPLEDVVSL